MVNTEGKICLWLRLTYNEESEGEERDDEVLEGSCWQSHMAGDVFIIGKNTHPATQLITCSVIFYLVPVFITMSHYVSVCFPSRMLSVCWRSGDSSKIVGGRCGRVRGGESREANNGRNQYWYWLLTRYCSYYNNVIDTGLLLTSLNTEGY